MHNTESGKRKRGAPSAWMLIPMAALYAVLYLGEEGVKRPGIFGEWLVTTALVLLLLLPPFALGWGVGWGVGRMGNDPTT